MDSNDASLSDMMQLMNDRISELKDLMILRHVPVGFESSNFIELEHGVKSVEQQLLLIDKYLAHEKEMVSDIRSLLDSAVKQQDKIKNISNNLPLRLPGVDFSASSDIITKEKKESSNHTNLNEKKDAKKLSAKEETKKTKIQRNYVTVNEMNGLPTYMKGRLTIDKINAHLDEIVNFSENTLKILSTPKKKLGAENMEKVLELREISEMEQVKGKYFSFESDFKTSSVIKMDNTFKSIITVLRHLGRLSEVRVKGNRVLILN